MARNAHLDRPIKALARVSRELDAAEAVQWEAAPIPKPREDTSSRAIGGHGDPTADTALDARRQVVREAVVGAHAALESVALQLDEVGIAVRSAVAHWEGE